MSIDQWSLIYLVFYMVLYDLFGVWILDCGIVVL